MKPAVKSNRNRAQPAENYDPIAIRPLVFLGWGGQGRARSVDTPDGVRLRPNGVRIGWGLAAPDGVWKYMALRRMLRVQIKCDSWAAIAGLPLDRKVPISTGARWH